MRLSFVRNGRKYPITPDSSGLSADTGQECPKCGKPLRVGGANKRISSYDTYTATAVSACCNQKVGELDWKRMSACYDPGCGYIDGLGGGKGIRNPLVK